MHLVRHMRFLVQRISRFLHCATVRSCRFMHSCCYSKARHDPSRRRQGRHGLAVAPQSRGTRSRRALQQGHVITCSDRSYSVCGLIAEIVAPQMHSFWSLLACAELTHVILCSFDLVTADQLQMHIFGIRLLKWLAGWRWCVFARQNPSRCSTMGMQHDCD